MVLRLSASRLTGGHDPATVTRVQSLYTIPGPLLYLKIPPGFGLFWAVSGLMPPGVNLFDPLKHRHTVRGSARLRRHAPRDFLEYIRCYTPKKGMSCNYNFTITFHFSPDSFNLSECLTLALIRSKLTRTSSSLARSIPPYSLIFGRVLSQIFPLNPFVRA